MKTGMILAHRGFSGRYPENTRAAFLAAAEVPGCAGFETDVHLTADGRAVILHDADISRVSSGTGLVYKLTYDELLHFGFGVKFDPKFKGERIMLLSGLLELVSAWGLFLNIELKNDQVPYQDFEKTIISMVKEYALSGRVLLSSFNHQSMYACKQIDPSIKTGLLYLQPLCRAERYAEICRAEALYPHHRLLSFEPELIARAHVSGIAVNAWTVDDPQDFKTVTALGADAVITNFPDRFCPLPAEKGDHAWM